MERRNVEKLNAPSDFLTANVSGARHAASPPLLTPSHFTVSSVCSLAPPCTASVSLPLPRPIAAPDAGSSVGEVGLGCPRPPVPPGADPWIIIAHAQQELLELRRENQRLLLQHRDGVAHSPEQHHRDRLREEQRGEVERLKEELRQQDHKISRQNGEHEALCVELSSCEAELEQTKEKLTKLQEECDVFHEQWEREVKSSKEGTCRLQLTTQEQMKQLCESHSAELSSLIHANRDLQNTLHTLSQEVTSLRRQVEEVTLERDELKQKLSTLSTEMMEQTDTLQKLRSYIGTQTGEEHHTHMQRLQNEKESLCLSIELLNVRVKSANDILALQEREMSNQCDPLHRDCRAARLLSVWRQKVFTLLIQLRSRDTQVHSEKCLLHTMVSDLRQEVQKFQCQISVLQHNLQDKMAQLELHNIHTQELQQQLCSATEKNERLKQQKETSEKLLRDVTDTAHRTGVWVEQWESQIDTAQGHMKTLTQRLTFATKRLDTVHGLLLRRTALRKAQEATKPAASDSCIERLQSEVVLLSSERNKLAQELKRTPELIQNTLRDLQQQLEREVGLLTQALARSREERDVCEQKCFEAQKQCEEQERTIAELRAEAHTIQQHCQRVLKERVSEVQSSYDKQLSEMEAQLNTARREHTKAVVALRQVERTAERAREQEREAELARSEHTHRHVTQLHTQLKEKERDCSILLAVVQQQGLMSEYKKMRKAAVLTSRAILEQQHKQQKHKQQQQPGDEDQQEGCILSVLGEVHSLSSAVFGSDEEAEGEEAEGEEEDEKGQGDHISCDGLT